MTPGRAQATGGQPGDELRKRCAAGCALLAAMPGKPRGEPKRSHDAGAFSPALQQGTLRLPSARLHLRTHLNPRPKRRPIERGARKSTHRPEVPPADILGFPRTTAPKCSAGDRSGTEDKSCGRRHASPNGRRATQTARRRRHLPVREVATPEASLCRRGSRRARGRRGHGAALSAIPPALQQGSTRSAGANSAWRLEPKLLILRVVLNDRCRPEARRVYAAYMRTQLERSLLWPPRRHDGDDHGHLIALCPGPMDTSFESHILALPQQRPQKAASVVAFHERRRHRQGATRNPSARGRRRAARRSQMRLSRARATRRLHNHRQQCDKAHPREDTRRPDK